MRTAYLNIIAARIWYKFHGDRPSRYLRTPRDYMTRRDLMNVRPRSREFVEACIHRLLLGALYKYGHLSVLSDHAVELIREEFQQGRSGNPISASNTASIDTTTAEVS